MKVKFKYKIDQWVETPFDTVGIVSMQGVDSGGKCYYVKTKKRGEWFREKQLSEV